MFWVFFFHFINRHLLPDPCLFTLHHFRPLFESIDAINFSHIVLFFRFFARRLSQTSNDHFVPVRFFFCYRELCFDHRTLCYGSSVPTAALNLGVSGCLLSLKPSPVVARCFASWPKDLRWQRRDDSEQTAAPRLLSTDWCSAQPRGILCNGVSFRSCREKITSPVSGKRT